MKLIRELTEEVKLEILEGVEGGPKRYFLEGIFIQADKKNRNGRLYPQNIVDKEVKRYGDQMITTKRALGELGHPDTGTINLDRASHIITTLAPHGSDYLGKAKILDTPMGKIAKNFIDEGVKLGVSTRGFGTLSEMNGYKQVGEDFHLSTVDIVADPSAPDAFVSGIMEGKEFYLREGVITEMARDQIVKEVKGLSGNQISEGALLKIFDKFLQGIGK